MLVGLKEILKDAIEKEYAVPAFNVYNMETVIGIISACEEKRSPVIIQFYSRLASSGLAEYLLPVMVKAANKATVPVCIHLDHGAGFEPATIAVKNGASSIMVDFSTLPLEENILNTKKAVDWLSVIGLDVEGELGHIGSASEEIHTDYTTVEDAEKYVKETGVVSLAIAVGTAHGRYKQAPKIAISRIKEIYDKIKIPLVLHGGSGVPDDQIQEAIKAGIRKVNFGTDLCYSFLDEVFNTDRSIVPIDLFMRGPINSVKNFAITKINLLGSNGKA